ncbi:spermine oxidase isoform X1 [Huso huso]|uniref:Spermine oxidase isoform X1 n=1 Tax=Huso huso TaxID=61971 RepID=A0ABR0ZJ87_HUSHU
MATLPVLGEPRIVIVGAGISGLAAAASLVSNGFRNVTVLEAMDRPGGRIHTTKPFGTNVIELGANWIHGQEGNPIYQLAMEYGLLAEEGTSITMCVPSSITRQDYFFSQSGKQLPPEQVEQVCCFFSKLMSKAFDQELDVKYDLRSLGSYLDEEFKASDLASSEDARKVFEWCKRSECTDEACSSLYEFSVGQLWLYTALEGGFFNSVGSGGYQALLDVFLKSLSPGVLLCNKPVKCIQWGLSETSISFQGACPVRVLCEDGQQLEADHVIVTASLGYLQDNSSTMFKPVLPEEKMRAIERLGFGVVSKIFLEFEKRFWPQDCAGIQLVWEEGPEDRKVYKSSLGDEGWKDKWYKKICGFDMVARHPNVLCGWITGREAEHMEGLEEKTVGEVCVRLLRSFTGWEVPDPLRVLMSQWRQNPYVRGAYTYIPLGVDAMREQEALAEPLPLESCDSISKPLQVLFAGEATHVQFYTTTHGAYLTGVREAQRIIQHYSDRLPSPNGERAS